ncbi:MAG TPA: LD-carboxypeptidase [Rhodothermales bacterium]|nr:LD-carboxypeptidase [Rhodothermales bacterium]
MKPTPLRPGDTIAVIAPASAPTDYDKLAGGIAHLKSLGYDVVTARETFDRVGYLCGTDGVRLEELNGFLRRPDVKALFCVRGGFGTLRLLPYIDYQAARRDPKLVVGYSDVTALHLALYQKAGLTGISGLMVAVEWSAPEAASERLFWDLAQGAAPSPLLGPAGEVLEPVRPGSAEGVLLGGNFTLITRLIGTPYLPSLDGAILFLEEVGEQPYRLDGMFAQLKLSGILDRLGGLVIGGFTEWEPPHDRPTLTLEEVIGFYTRGLNLPVAKGLVYGHFPIKSPIPVGVRARLTVTPENAELHILEPVVA